MPAAVLVVHNARDTRDLSVTALRAAFLEAVGFEDPMAALDAMEANSRVPCWSPAWISVPANRTALLWRAWSE
jgi:hypothetical protein